MKGHSQPQQVSSSVARPEECVLAPREAAAGGQAWQKPAEGRTDLALRGSDLIPLQPCGCPGTAASAGGVSDAILCEKYRALAKHHLRTLPALFTKLTGLFSHLAWAPTWPQQWSAHNLPTQSRLCRPIVAGCSNTLGRCRRCAERHLDLALKSGHNGHRFTCFMGVHNFWLPLMVRGCLVGLAFVQALALPAAGAPVRQIPFRATRAAAPTTPVGGLRHFCRGAKRMNRERFGEAAKLMRLVFQHVETSALADLRQSDLSRAQQALVELQTVATRLRKELNDLVPVFRKTAPVLEAENHTDRLAHDMLEYIHRHYSETFTLQQYADRLRMNAAYLSAQFSRAVGIPFKTYLTEVRVEKARELLGDSTHSVCDVAYAVGYASENRFRIAFKKVTGLSPKLWRETLRMDPIGQN